jgi:uncharacterized membrane protein YqiK
MANLFFLVLAIVLLLVAVFSLVSYIKDRKKAAVYVQKKALITNHHWRGTHR